MTILPSPDIHELQVRAGRRIFLWDAANNELGTHKDLAARPVIAAAARDGYAGVSVGSCGHYGLAIAFHARARGLRAVVVIPDRYVGTLAGELSRLGADVVRYGSTYEDAVDRSRELAALDGLADANVDGPYEDAVLDSVTPVLAELLQRLPEPPSRVHVPLGNGTTVVAVARALRAVGVSASIVGITSAGNNSVAASWMAGGHAPLDPTTLRETAINEPLCNWRALHGVGALSAIRASGGTVVEASDVELAAASAVVRDATGVVSPPPGGAGLVSALLGYAAGTDLVMLTTSRRAAEPTSLASWLGAANRGRRRAVAAASCSVPAGAPFSTGAPGRNAAS